MSARATLFELVWSPSSRRGYWVRSPYCGYSRKGEISQTGWETNRTQQLPAKPCNFQTATHDPPAPPLLWIGGSRFVCFLLQVCASKYFASTGKSTEMVLDPELLVVRSMIIEIRIMFQRSSCTFSNTPRRANMAFVLGELTATATTYS